MVSDARTDFAVFCCLVLLISVGGGAWSLDARLDQHNRSTAFGLFDSGFGVAWFLGSWMMGVVYGRSIPAP
jgi:predicted MFS family arabinose efflux permease